MRFLLLHLARKSVAAPLLLALTVIHPVLHGTPLDGGALDAFILNLQIWTFQVAE
jgi:hypothetical protein